MSLGEPFKHDALLLKYTLESGLESRIASPLLDVLGDGGADGL